MARRPSYTRRVPALLEDLRRGLRDDVRIDGEPFKFRIPNILGTDHVAGVLGVSSRQAARLLAKIGVKASGKALVIRREDLAKYLIHLYEEEGGDVVLKPYRDWLARREDSSLITVPTSTRQLHESVVEGVELEPGRMIVKATSWKELMKRLAALTGVASQPKFRSDVDQALSGGGGE